MAQLDVQDITVRFGGNIALDEVSLEAEPGVVTGLIGPNGAGKTTLFNVITGLLPLNQGRVRLADADLNRLSPTKRARRGLARTFQRLELFSLLSVRENIRVAADVRRGWSRDKDDPAEVVERIIERVGLTAVADARVDSLPTGQCRLVELGRCLATKPQVLLLDEPASGQDEHETLAFAELLRDLAAGGMPSCWSSTTCNSSWTSALVSTSSTSVGSSPRGPRPRSRPTRPCSRPTWVAAREPPRSSGTSAPRTSASTCSTASTSRFRPARSWRCSGPTARARPPRCGSRPGCTRRPPARSIVAGRRVNGVAPEELARRGLCLDPRGSRGCSRT